MKLSRDHKESIRARVRRDPEFKKELLIEGIECLLSGDIRTGKTVLRDYIKATTGVEEFARILHKKPESIFRMLGSRGNPTANNLFLIISQIQKQEGLRFKVNILNLKEKNSDANSEAIF